jgi:hypothetical protein
LPFQVSGFINQIWQDFLSFATLVASCKPFPFTKHCHRPVQKLWWRAYPTNKVNRCFSVIMLKIHICIAVSYFMSFQSSKSIQTASICSVKWRKPRKRWGFEKFLPTYRAI